MNQRIQELETQCWKTQQLTSDAHSWHTSFNAQKFAELIVRECIEINRQRFFPDYEGNLLKVSHNNALWCAISDMKEHFGVME